MNHEMCRLCLTDDNLRPIFVDVEQCERYSRVLRVTTGLRIESNDGLPQLICAGCIARVDTALSLRNQSHLSHTKLTHLGYKRITKEITDFQDGEMKSECEIDSLKAMEWPKIKRPNAFKSKEFNETTENRQDIKTQDSIVAIEKCEEDSDLKLECRKQPVLKINIAKPKIKQTKLKNSDPIAGEDGFSELKNEMAEAGTKQPEMSRKEKRAMYMDLVEGDFDPKGPVKCKVCKKTVSKWACFVSHAKLHLGFKFVCEYCGKSFISSTQLKRHCRSWHGLARELACRYCSYLALDAPQLLLHERRAHTGERPFVCDACAARYHSRRCLLQHLEAHRNTRDVQCPECPALLKSRRHLARHRYSAHCQRRGKRATTNSLQSGPARSEL